MDAAADSKINSYRDLIVWQRAMDLIDVVYLSSRSWPKEELFGLTSQIRRAVVSVAANIAEGSGRRSKGEYAHHLGIARGSLHEVTTLAVIAGRQGHLDQDQVTCIEKIADEVGRLLSGLIRSLSKT